MHLLTKDRESFLLKFSNLRFSEHLLLKVIYWKMGEFNLIDHNFRNYKLKITKNNASQFTFR